MKKFITFTLAWASIFSFNAQQQAPPQGINYQAVAMDNSGKETVGIDVDAQPVAEKEIRVRFSIIKTSETGTLTYREVHLVKTDAYGLFNTVIGQGIPDASPMNFDQIDWGTGYHFLKVEIDAEGGTDYTDMGTQQLWSVPYALYSKYADVAGNGIESVTDNGDGTLTFTYLDGSTYTTPPLAGITGPQGPAGATGPAGQSAFELWIAQGNTGTLQDFLNTLVGPAGPQGPSGLLTNGTVVGNTPFWNGTDWVVNSSNIYNNGGNVGVGTSTPASKLEVNGSVSNSSALNAGSNSTIDFGQSNLAYTSATGTAITLQNLKNGGAYTLIFVNNTASGTVLFTASGFSFVQMGTFARTIGKKHIYNFVVVGNEVYVTMAKEN